MAHRLSTVADFDRLLVLEAGRVAEIGTPADLLRTGMNNEAKGRGGERGDTETEMGQYDGMGAFWELVKKSAEKDKLVEIILGQERGATSS